MVFNKTSLAATVLYFLTLYYLYRLNFVSINCETEKPKNCQYLSALRQIPVHLLHFQFSDLESVWLRWYEMRNHEFQMETIFLIWDIQNNISEFWLTYSIARLAWKLARRIQLIQTPVANFLISTRGHTKLTKKCFHDRFLPKEKVYKKEEKKVLVKERSPPFIRPQTTWCILWH